MKLKANPTTVAEGENSTLSWTSEGADRCWASGGWSGTRSFRGSFNTGRLWRSALYTLTCQKGGERALSSLTVAVGTVPVVKWQAPASNVDGTPVADLAGYRVYWGRRSRSYTGNARIKSPTRTRFMPDNLPSGTYFVAVTALDTQGNESSYSNEIRVRIP